ncbi:MAG: T9SS type A sorting domain-containing protein [Elusimicrobia bacterium]|nr:T9SS type A sorting domain-containing protein [Elusimicrobiota bacterium]
MHGSRLRGLTAGLVLAMALLPQCSHASFNLTLSPLTNIYSWAATTDPSSTTAKVLYYVKQKFGMFHEPVTFNPLTEGTTIATVFDNTSVTLGGRMTGSFCTIVLASTTVSGIFDWSIPGCHSYLHYPGGGNQEGIYRVDGSGTQIGFNQQWYLKYSLDQDSLVTLSIYPPGTSLTTDTSGFLSVSGSPTPTKVIVSSTPRSGETFDGSFMNTEMWDSRNSSGNTVSNGIYFAQFIVTNSLFTQTTRYIGVYTIPVDIIRFTAFSTEGISPTSSLAKINYTITGDATVRIVVAKPGRRFSFDGNGDVQSLNAAGSDIDTSTESVVQVLTYNKRAGSYSETWNGTDTAGVAVSSGIYSIGLSARDAFGNQALNLSGGHDGPVQGTIPVERSASQSATDTTAPTLTAIAVGGTSIALGGGTSISNSFTSILFTLNEIAGTCTVSLTGPGGLVAGGSVSASSNTVTYSTSTVQSSTGNYTLSIIARDANGNANTFTDSFALSAAGGGGSAAQSFDDVFKSSIKAYPNPVRRAPLNIKFTLTAAASVDFDLFNLLGERAFHATMSYPAGTQTFPWDLINDASNTVGNGVYLLRLSANTGRQTVRVTKKVMVIRE